MAHTFTCILVHLVYSTKGWAPFIKPEIKPRLYSYMGGIVRSLGGAVVAINGTADHVHMLVQAPQTVPVSDMMRVVKSKSSIWVKETFAGTRGFAWQTGYGAFISVSHSHKTRVERYIEGQEEHHRKVSFREEFLEMLRQAGIEFDEEYLWR